MAFSRDDYRRLLKQLTPLGLAMAGPPGSIIDDLRKAFAQFLQLLDDRVAGLLQEACKPLRANELLPEWETDYGLPDGCTGPGSTVEERRLQVYGRMSATGGSSLDYLEQAAASAGYTITVNENRPFRFGRSTYRSALNGHPLPFRLSITAQAENPILFRFGRSGFRTPFRKVGNERLECLINRIKPAHTEALFIYDV